MLLWLDFLFSDLTLYLQSVIPIKSNFRIIQMTANGEFVTIMKIKLYFCNYSSSFNIYILNFLFANCEFLMFILILHSVNQISTTEIWFLMLSVHFKTLILTFFDQCSNRHNFLSLQKLSIARMKHKLF